MIDQTATVTITPDEAMQHAVDLLYTPANNLLEYQALTQRASMCVSMAKELRLGRTKSRKYSEVERPQTSPPRMPEAFSSVTPTP